MSDAETVSSIGPDGCWQVVTETSTYVVDLDAGTCVRVPDAGLGALPVLPRAQVSALRRDHESLSLLSVTQAEVGSPLTMLLDVRRDGVPTIRRSTIVREIRRLRASGDGERHPS